MQIMTGLIKSTFLIVISFVTISCNNLKIKEEKTNISSQDSINFASKYNDTASYRVLNRNFDEALVYINKAVEFSNKYHYRLNRAVILNSLGKHKEALADLNFLIENNYTDQNCYFEMAQALFGTKNYYEAVRNYNTSIYLHKKRNDTDNVTLSFVYYRLGNTYLKLEEYNNAIKVYDTSFYLWDQNVYSLYQKGLALNEINSDSACYFLRKAIDKGYDKDTSMYNEICSPHNKPNILK